MKKVVKNSRTYFGNEEYPRLEISATYELERDGRYRITECEFEQLHRYSGWLPAPELFVIRKLQKNYFGFWITIHKYVYLIPTSQWIPSACFGEKQDYTNDWKKVRLFSIQHYFDTEPKYEVKIGKVGGWY